MLNGKSWRGRLHRRMEENDDSSTEDLISKQTDTLPDGPTVIDPTVMIEIPRQKAGGYKKNKTINRSSLILVLLLLLISVVFICLYFHEKNSLNKLKNQHTQGVCVTPGCVESAAAMLAAMDKTINPCDDFYLYSCAGWIKNNPIPPGEAMWDTILVVKKANERIMKDILENTQIKKSADLKSRAEYNAFKLYRSCKDLDTIDKFGIQPLVSLMNDVATFVPLKSSKSPTSQLKHNNMLDLFKVLYDKAYLQPFFSISVGRDDKNSSVNILQFSQSGLSLPAYIYNEKTNASKKIIKELINYGAALGSAMDQLITPEEFIKMANAVYNFEKKLKQIFVPSEKMITIDQTYNKTTLRQLQALSSHKFKWIDYVKNMFKSTNIQITEDEPIVVYSMPYFERLKSFMDDIDMVTVNNYVVFHLLETYASFLTEDIIALRKNFTIAARGTYKKHERWKRCVTATDSSIGMALGALFVKKTFVKDSFREANRMVERVRDSFIDGFKSLSWIDKATRLAAAEKAESIKQKIGYPPYILDHEKLDQKYAGLEFTEDEYFKNVLRDSKWATERSLKKLRQPVDTEEWYMTPPTVNAYYQPTENEIVFPAGILQPPYFKSTYPKSVNYGMMGSIIGHEITHGFDNNGRQYDKHGNFVPSWWTNNVVKEYEKRAKCFVDEYSKFKVETTDQYVKGNETLGENIADNGGLKASFKAYQNYIKQYGEEPLLPGVGVTNEQSFFIAFAQSWCTEELKQILIHNIETDSHSPAIERVRGSIQNNEDFARIFNCPVGSHMNPEKKCAIW